MRRQVAHQLSPVIGVGFGLVLLQAALRAWALYPSWFYYDDYRFIAEATGRPLSADYLLQPFDSQFMPLGRLLAWTVAHNGHLNWPLAASITLAVQLLVGLACLWMLVTLFGPRWGTIGLLAIYLSSAIMMPATMWWAASLNQLPWQLAFFLAVGSWVRHLRSQDLRWMVGAVLAVALGLLAYVKALLIPLVLAFVLLTWFVDGTPLERSRRAVRSYWPAAVTFGVLGVGYLVYYLTQVPQVFNKPKTGHLAGDLADSMLATSLTVGLAGGPWGWDQRIAPVATAAPPPWAIGLAWVLLAAVAAYLFLRRERTLRAWGLAGTYAAIAYVFVLTSRAPLVGGFIGGEYRYLTDVLPVAVLALGLAALELPGAPGSSAGRDEPLLTPSLPRRGSMALVCVISLAGLINSTAYARIWHDAHPGADYVETVRQSSQGERSHDMVNQALPTNVMPGYHPPHNSTSHFLPLVSPRFQFPRATDQLKILDDRGRLHGVLIDVAAPTVLDEAGGCAWQVTGPGSAEIDLESDLFNWTWWSRFGYLADRRSAVEVTAGSASVITEVEPGANSLYVRLDGSFDSITFAVREPGAKVCLGEVRVGLPVPGAPE